MGSSFKSRPRNFLFFGYLADNQRITSKKSCVIRRTRQHPTNSSRYVHH